MNKDIERLVKNTVEKREKNLEAEKLKIINEQTKELYIAPLDFVNNYAAAVLIRQQQIAAIAELAASRPMPTAENMVWDAKKGLIFDEAAYDTAVVRASAAAARIERKRNPAFAETGDKYTSKYKIELDKKIASGELTLEQKKALEAEKGAEATLKQKQQLPVMSSNKLLITERGKILRLAEERLAIAQSNVNSGRFTVITAEDMNNYVAGDESAKNKVIIRLK
ncbi:hypothetical protein, partial [Treponema sp. R6D11]